MMPMKPKIPRKTLLNDVKLIDELISASKKIVAERHDLTMRGLDSWIYRIRERKREAHWYINRLLTAEKRGGSRIKKMLLSSQPPLAVVLEELNDKATFEE